MRAARYHGRRDVRIEEIPAPGSPSPGQLLVQVTRAGICGTDVSEFLYGPREIPIHRGPIVLGHELVGRVIAVGSGVGEFSVGDRVVSGAGVSCGDCGWCRQGRTNLCTTYLTIGLQTDGALAESVSIPASTCCVVPDGCLDNSAAMAQPLAVGIHAVHRSGARRGEAIVLIGVGSIGSFILTAAQTRGLGPVIAVDQNEQRLRVARLLGAAHTINSQATDVKSAVRELTSGEGAPVTIEASGSEAGLSAAIGSVARGGRILIVGLQSKPREIDLADLVSREVDILTTLAHVCQRDIPAAIEILSHSDVANHVLDRVIALEDLVEHGLNRLASGLSAGKILVNPATSRVSSL